eukprot:2685834-Amphidinium_carterae.1
MLRGSHPIGCCVPSSTSTKSSYKDSTELEGEKFDSPIPSCEVGKCAEEAGYTPDEWWEEQMKPHVGRDVQSVYVAWLHALNLWLAVAEHVERNKCVRGAMTSRWTTTGLKSTSDHEPLAWQCHLAKKACAHLQELKSHGDRGCFDCDRCTCLRKKLESLPLSQIGLEGLQGHRRVTAEHVKVSKDFVGSAGRSIRQSLLAWKSEMLQSIVQGTSQVYKWLKFGPESIALVSEHGQIVAHPRKVLEAVHRHWEPVLSPPGYMGVNQQTKDTAIAAIGQCEYEVPPLTAAQLQKVALARSQSSPGLDHISLSELQGLPLSAWEPLAFVFREIELGQQWPQELLAFRWVPLSKGSPGTVVDVDRTRLVSVSSHVLRTWSTARAQQATEFLSRTVPLSAQGGFPNRCTFDLLSQSVAKWHIAQSSGLPHCEMSLDCSKCFDTLDAAALCDVAMAKNFMPQ